MSGCSITIYNIKRPFFLHCLPLEICQDNWLIYRGWQKQIYTCSYGKRYSGCDYYNSFNNSKMSQCCDVNLLLPTTVCVGLSLDGPFSPIVSIFSLLLPSFDYRCFSSFFFRVFFLIIHNNVLDSSCIFPHVPLESSRNPGSFYWETICRNLLLDIDLLTIIF